MATFVIKDFKTLTSPEQSTLIAGSGCGCYCLGCPPCSCNCSDEHPSSSVSGSTSKVTKSVSQVGPKVANE